jgi:hypothetical protein
MFQQLLALFKAKTQAKRKHGAITNHYRKKISTLQVGNTAFIPQGEFDIDVLRSSISSYTVKHWGRGAANTTIIREKNKVKVVRIS